MLAAVSLVVMPFLSWFERRTGRELGSASAVADSKQTLLCTYLSAVLLVGLVLNSTLGWTWADPLAALVIAAVAVKEGSTPGAETPAAPPSPPSWRRTALPATIILRGLWSRLRLLRALSLPLHENGLTSDEKSEAVSLWVSTTIPTPPPAGGGSWR